MENVLEPQEVRTEQKIRLVDGSFTASEAQDVILSLLEEKINFHKLRRLSMCEGNVYENTSYHCGRIEELEAEKEIAREFVNHIRQSGKQLRITGNLEITLVD